MSRLLRDDLLLRSPRVTLRPSREDDVDALVAVLAEPCVKRWWRENRSAVTWPSASSRSGRSARRNSGRTGAGVMPASWTCWPVRSAGVDAPAPASGSLTVKVRVCPDDGGRPLAYGQAMRKLTLLLLTGLAAFSAATAPALSAPAAPDWAAAHNLTATAYQAKFNELGAKGFRLTSVNGYVDKGKLRYAAVWRAIPGPAWTARHGLSPAAFQQQFDALGAQGYRLTYVSGWEVQGKERLAGIWEQRTGPAYTARTGLTGAQYQQLFDAQVKGGARLLHVSAYSKAGAPRYAAIFEQSGGPAFQSFAGMKPAAYQAKYTTLAKSGFTLKTVSGVRIAGADRYTALWEKASSNRAFRARSGIPVKNFQRAFDSDRFQGYFPLAVQGFGDGQTPAKLNAIWSSALSGADANRVRSAVESGLASARVAGASVAIAKDGRLLYAGGFGLADLKAKTKMDVRHRLRIGSISKSVTSVAIQRLIEQNRLPGGLGTKPFQPGGPLAAFKIPANMSSLKDATVAQLLEHTTGLPPLGDPLNCDKGSLANRLQDQINVQSSRPNPLLGAPGAVFRYSNTDTMLLEVLIEQVARMPYAAYVRDNVFTPSGIAPSAARLFKINDFDPATGEAGQYLTNGEYAPYTNDPPYDQGGAKTCDNKPPGTAAGGWSMSALDLMRFYVNVDGRPQREIITGQHRTDMITPSAATAMRSQQYARSWMTGSWGWCGVGSPIVQGHNGGVSGGFSDLFELPNGYSIAVMVNQDVATPRCGARAMANLVSLVDKIDWPEHDLFG